MAVERTHAASLRPDDAAAPAVDAVAQHYKLTTAERRVLSAVVETGGVRSVAVALGISQATVKTHLMLASDFFSPVDRHPSLTSIMRLRPWLQCRSGVTRPLCWSISTILPSRTR